MSFLSHLPRYGEYPVPFIVSWVGNVPDFRVVDMVKWERCVNEQLCSICGYRLGELSYIVGGPITGATYLFFDPPMHKPCADFSSRVCPYVNGERRKFSERPVPVPHTSMDDIQPRNASAELYIYTIRTSQIRLVHRDGHQLLQARRMIGKRLIDGR